MVVRWPEYNRILWMVNNVEFLSTFKEESPLTDQALFRILPDFKKFLMKILTSLTTESVSNHLETILTMGFIIQQS